MAAEADARRRLVSSLATPIGLIKHAPPPSATGYTASCSAWTNPHATATPPGDGSFVVADGETLADVIAADFELADTKTHPRAGDVSLRFIYLLPIEDFARHADHGDILRKQIAAAR